MFAKKILLTVAGAILAIFTTAPVESLVAHRGYSGSTAWAQSADETADDTADEADVQPPTIAYISGSYSGPVSDDRFGNGTLSVTIGQNNTRLSGTWSTDLNGGFGGTVKGKVKSYEKATIRMKIQGPCGLVGHATLQNDNEIVGKYTVVGCGHADHGTFDITD